MIKRFMFLLLLGVLLLSACSTSTNNDLSGRTFDVSVKDSPNNPDRYTTLMTLEFSDENVIINSVNNSIQDEEGTYELKDDNLVIHLENENESAEVEFILNESDKEISEYSAEIIDSNFQIEDSEQTSEYKRFMMNLPQHTLEILEK
ncbi:hypothetical protein [Alkalibacillus silvisoli]|uniref:Intracellular proteinase inhibitor BsuPI domain-containing protein n=1 Tax=Alkalibacillus silvisoli TaxID=392823 RepID=A0ABN1AB68_9BACI